jgi:two-component system response regulator MprA
MADQPHVLVVDDDAKIAAALRRALIYEGYQVEVAPDGQIALSRARERMPDLAILDIMMPGMDGLEVTRRLRAEGDVPILLLTAKDGTADRVRGLDQGADDYLIKPFAYEELLARVRALLRRRAPRARRTLRYADGPADLDDGQGVRLAAALHAKPRPGAAPGAVARCRVGFRFWRE